MIETRDLGKRFDELWAVQALNINVQEGQVLALLGQNGAGKTTTVRMLTGLLTPSRGWAKVAGLDVVRRADAVRGAAGVLTEQHGLYLRMSGEEYLEFFGSIYGLTPSRRKDRARQLLEHFELLPAASRRIGEYSKGMRQKLALARALIHEPAVLLLDEPTSAMDPESARLVRDEISRLRSSKRAIVMCTHNLVEAELLADRIVILFQGRVLIEGTVAELKAKVLGPPEFEVRFSRPWDSVSLSLPPGSTIIAASDMQVRLRVERPEQTNTEIARALLAVAAPLIAIQEAPRTLEQVYLKVMALAREGNLVH